MVYFKRCLVAQGAWRRAQTELQKRTKNAGEKKMSMVDNFCSKFNEVESSRLTLMIKKQT